MSLHPYQKHRTPRERVDFAAAYPFERPVQSYLFVDGEAHPLAAFDPENMQGGTRLKDGARVPELGDAPRWPVIASGSNASPNQLARKYPEKGHIIPTVKAILPDFAVVYSAHITGYGSVAATIQYDPGNRTEIFVNFLTEDQLTIMHATEVLGRHYAFGKLDDLNLDLEVGGRLSSAWAYITIMGCLAKNGTAIALSAVPQQSPTIPNMDQRGVLEFIRTLLNPDHAFDDFVHAHIVDRELRINRETHLQDNHSVPFSYPYTTE